MDLIFRSVEDRAGSDVKSDRDIQYWEKIAQRKVLADPKTLAAASPPAKAGAAAAGSAAGAGGAAAQGQPGFKFSLFAEDDEGLEEYVGSSLPTAQRVRLCRSPSKYGLFVLS